MVSVACQAVGRSSEGLFSRHSSGGARPSNGNSFGPTLLRTFENITGTRSHRHARQHRARRKLIAATNYDWETQSISDALA